MTHIEGTTFTTDIEWDKEGRPIYYVVGHGQVTQAKTVLDIIAQAVKMVDEGPFQHVCAVYNMLDVTHLPHLARFISGGRFPTSMRTAHIVVGTHDRALQLAASLIAVMGGKRLRTLEVCRSQEELDAAIKRWLDLPDRAREYTIRDI